MDILSNAVLIACLITAVDILMSRGYPLAFIRSWFEGQLNWVEGLSSLPPYPFSWRVLNFLYKPTFGCAVCMNSVWGTGYLFLNSEYNLISWLMTILVSVTLTAALVKATS